MLAAEVRRFFQDKHVLITGGGGYLAAGLVRLLASTACHIVRLGHSGGQRPPAEGISNVKDATCDIRNHPSWESELAEADIVFHLAAQTSTSVAAENPKTDMEINVLPMLQMLETCRNLGLSPTLVFSGTVTEAGLPTRLPVNESHPDDPITIYDMHKYFAERYLRHYASQGIVSGTTLRLANLYGPGPRSSSPERGVLNQMIRKGLNGDPLTVYGEGRYVRDYVYVDDVARAFLVAATRIGELNHRHYVVGSGQGHTIAEAASLVTHRIAVKVGVEAPVTYVDPPTPLPPIETRNFVADFASFSKVTGWTPSVSLSGGIDRTIEAFLAEELRIE